MNFNNQAGTKTDKTEISAGWQSRFREAGHRLTRPRRAVLEVMAEAETALTAAEIHRLARSRYDRTGLVTVYRTLGLLVEMGLAHRLVTEEGIQVYARADLRPPSHHLICQSCHRTVEFPCTGLEEVIEAIEQQTGFAVRGHWLELFGLCPACRKEEQ